MKTDFLTLDQLCDKLRQEIGTEFTITWQEFHDGSSQCIAEVRGKVAAQWFGRLANDEVPIDGVTPRGPKEYFGLRFFKEIERANAQ